MRKYPGFHEITFKIPDYHFQRLQDMAMYLYEAKDIDKPLLGYNQQQQQKRAVKVLATT
jgi:hypothetical protein